MQASTSKLKNLVPRAAMIVLILAGWSGDTRSAAAQSEPANFLIDGATNQQDAEIIVEGIRLAQDFVAAELGATIDTAVHVTTRPGADAQDAGLVAFSMGRSIVIYTGSPGWLQSSPAEKLSTVIHEYTHYYQYMRTGEEHDASAAWFEEGFAEYLALTALDQSQIVDRESIESWFATTLIIIPPAFALTELESHTAFNALGTTNYPYAYFAVKEVFEGKPLDVVDKYYGLLAEGSAFDQAFSAAFGIAPKRHYRVVEEQMATLSGSAEMPDDIAVSEGIEKSSPVRISLAPDQVQAGDQALIQARTVEESVCTLVFQSGGDSAVSIKRRTFADGDGDVFWLVTIPGNLPPGNASLTLDCGLEPVVAPVEIAA